MATSTIPTDQRRCTYVHRGGKVDVVTVAGVLNRGASTSFHETIPFANQIDDH
jgi:hypothetical protein